jgi:hypothetical protein
MFLPFREVVEDLRSSLQLSDAQNLALQVIFFKECHIVVGDVDETSKISTNYGMPLNRCCTCTFCDKLRIVYETLKPTQVPAPHTKKTILK